MKLNKAVAAAEKLIAYTDEHGFRGRALLGLQDRCLRLSEEAGISMLDALHEARTRAAGEAR
jgi:hypothetical protein